MHLNIDLHDPVGWWFDPQQTPQTGSQALRAAQAAGHEIGNHTRTHPHLADLTRDEQLLQIAGADRMLRNEGIDVGSFCYPYGSVGDVSAVREGGYRVGVSLIKRVASDSDDRLQLPRVVVAFSDTVPMLLYKIHVRPRLR